MEISETLRFEAPIEQVYDAFADLDRWPVILPDTVGVVAPAGDGAEVQFTVNVLPALLERLGGEETGLEAERVRMCDELDPLGAAVDAVGG